MGVCLRFVIGNEYPAVPLPNVGIAAQRNVTDSLAVNGVVRVAHLPRPRRPLRLTHQNDTPSRSPSLAGRTTFTVAASGGLTMCGGHTQTHLRRPMRPLRRSTPLRAINGLRAQPSKRYVCPLCRSASW